MRYFIYKINCISGLESFEDIEPIAEVFDVEITDLLYKFTIPFEAFAYFQKNLKANSKYIMSIEKLDVLEDAEAKTNIRFVLNAFLLSWLDRNVEVKLNYTSIE